MECEFFRPIDSPIDRFLVFNMQQKVGEQVVECAEIHERGTVVGDSDRESYLYCDDFVAPVSTCYAPTPIPLWNYQNTPTVLGLIW